MSGTALKLVALAMMFLDHVAQFIPDMPVWMHWLGRISAPVFLFCLVWGMEHTRSQFRYLSRLYIAGVLMGALDLAVHLLVRKPYAPLQNNFFVSLFLTGFLIAIYELYKSDKESGKRLLIIFLIVQVISIIMCSMVTFGFSGLHLEYLICALLPNVVYTEGGFLVVVLGLLFYWYRNEPKWLAGTFGATCLMYAILVFVENGASINAVLYTDYQWMMALAIPLFLCYDGTRGQGMKYLFYVFYPAHLLLLFVLGNMVYSM